MNGLRDRKQLYKCKDCGRRFDGGIRRDKSQVILEQLAVKYKDVTIQMDTTYWGGNFGLMVIRDAIRGNVLWHKSDRYETIAQYVEGVDWLKSNGFHICGAVIDGLKGLAQALKPIKVQICQFHQMLIVRRYLTQDPDLEASQELLNLINIITKTDKESFIGAFEDWCEKYKDVINERVHDIRIKRHY